MRLSGTNGLMYRSQREQKFYKILWKRFNKGIEPGKVLKSWVGNRVGKNDLGGRLALIFIAWQFRRLPTDCYGDELSRSGRLSATQTYRGRALQGRKIRFQTILVSYGHYSCFNIGKKLYLKAIVHKKAYDVLSLGILVLWETSYVPQWHIVYRLSKSWHVNCFCQFGLSGTCKILQTRFVKKYWNFCYFGRNWHITTTSQ